MPKYILDPCVESELEAIWSYIAQDRPQAATDVVDAVFTTFRNLAENPRIGTCKFKTARLREVRSIPVPGYPYLVFYRVVADGVQIHHVHHGARNLAALFNDK